LGGLWADTGQQAFNTSPLAAWLFPHQPLLSTGEVEPAALGSLIEHLDDADDTIRAATPTSGDGAVVQAELLQATGLARHAARRRMGPAGPPADVLARDLRTLIDGQRAAWLARARPGGLDDSLAHLERLLPADG